MRIDLYYQETKSLSHFRNLFIKNIYDILRNYFEDAKKIISGEQMDENAMIQYAKDGDMDAFNRLVLEYQDLAFQVAYRIMGEMESAEDVVQESFIAAYRKINTFKGGSFKAWVCRIVTNRCYDELRKRKRRPTIPLDPLNEDDETIDSNEWLEDPGESPEESAIRTELNSAIQWCLNKLDFDFRTVVVLIDIQGIDYKEAAEIVKKPLGTVKSRLARARHRLQDCLQNFAELLPSSYRLNSKRTAE
jgi:RNA polymerase sigma-70 factor (ECF subfamily)